MFTQAENSLNSRQKQSTKHHSFTLQTLSQPYKWNSSVSLTAEESLNLNLKKRKTNTFMFCSKLCIAKIGKWDIFGIAIMENYIAFRDRDTLNSNSALIITRWGWRIAKLNQRNISERIICKNEFIQNMPKFVSVKTNA